MVPTFFFYELVWWGLLWLCLILFAVLSPRDRAAPGQPTSKPAKPTHKPAKDLKPFPGLTQKPRCDACAHAAEASPPAPSAPPPRLSFTRGRRRTIDMPHHFCPDPDCSYYGWVGRGNLRSNGHPGGNPWRQLQCVVCRGYFQESHSTPVYGKRVSPEMLAWAVGT